MSETVNGNTIRVESMGDMAPNPFRYRSNEIDKVLDECMSGDDDHLLQTLIPICKPIESEDDL